MVIDSPPVLSVSDASTIARFTDSTIFIVRWAKTPIPAVVEALRQLRAINTKILGVVLTQVNAQEARDVQLRRFGSLPRQAQEVLPR